MWWGNEVFHTIRLADAGVLAAYESPAAKDVPAKFKDAAAPLGRQRAAGAGDRDARQQPGAAPQAQATLARRPRSSPSSAAASPSPARPRARPAGTSRRCTSCGAASGSTALLEATSRPTTSSCSAATARSPRRSGAATCCVGLTDNDDVAAVQRNGGDIAAVPARPGRRRARSRSPPPSALVAGANNPDAAKKLIDYLLSPEVEQKLIDAQFAGWSVRAGTGELKPMGVDYREVAKVLDRAANEAHAILVGRE